MRVLDIFPYFNERELLELRINLLKDKVDQFIICDANITQSGLAKDFSANQTVQELGLQGLANITVLEIDLSNFSQAPPMVREREQRNVAASYITDDAVAIVSDCDEIMDPTFVDHYCTVARRFHQCLVRIPMVLLSGRADLQVVTDEGKPMDWRSGFICLPHHLSKYTLSEMREAYSMGLDIEYDNIIPLQGNKLEDAGWHFSWMGNDIIKKYKACAHLTDSIDGNISTYTDQSILSFMETYVPEENTTDVFGRRNHILKKYDIERLPAKLFDLPKVLRYLLPHREQPHIYQDPNFGEDWFSYPNLYRHMVNNFPSGSTFVEVGSWKGKSSAFMCVEIINSKKNIAFYCIDTWDGSVEHHGIEGIKNLYDTFLSNMEPLKGYYAPIRLPSVTASAGFKNSSVDFVFIDASHDYDSVIQDILTWVPKIKAGGVLAGHDYYPDKDYCGVYKAVSSLFDLEDIQMTEDCFIVSDPQINLLKHAFHSACNTPSDINEHLSYLYELAKSCESVVELGVRDGKSTRAFLYAGGKLRSYDLELDNTVSDLFTIARSQGMDAQYIKGDTGTITIDVCDLLFIDTLHTYKQLQKELAIHGNKAKKYLVFHDTQSYGTKGEDGDLGLLTAIFEFLIDNPAWRIETVFTNNNGLLVLSNRGAV